VAKVCFIAALTFWLGNATVLGLGVAYAPQAASAIDQLAPWFNRLMAFGIIGMLATYVVWVWRTPCDVGRHNWLVTLPNGPLTCCRYSSVSSISPAAPPPCTCCPPMNPISAS